MVSDGDGANTSNATLFDLGGADTKGCHGPVHSGGLQLAGTLQSLAEADDTGEPVDHVEAIVAGPADQHATGIGAKIDGRIFVRIFSRMGHRRTLRFVASVFAVAARCATLKVGHNSCPCSPPIRPPPDDDELGRIIAPGVDLQQGPHDGVVEVLLGCGFLRPGCCLFRFAGYEWAAETALPVGVWCNWQHARF